MHRRELRERYVSDGHQLEIIAIEMWAGEWELSVENCHGVRSTWYEIFTSAELAIEAAKKTMDSEGVSEFVDIDDFGYLKDG